MEQTTMKQLADTIASTTSPGEQFILLISTGTGHHEVTDMSIEFADLVLANAIIGRANTRYHDATQSAKTIHN